MKNIVYIFFIFSFVLFGCGQNAHITDALIDAEPGDEIVTPDPVPVPHEIRSYIGNATDGLTGGTTTGFTSELAMIGAQSVEDFNAMVDSTVLIIGNTIDGVTYSLIHTDDDGGLGVGSRNNYIESPVSQDGATSGSRGLDLRFGSGTTLNMLSVSFDQAVAHVGLDLLDFESSSAFTLGILRVYDCVMPVPSIIETVNLDFGAEDGDAEIHFVGVSSTAAEFCHFTVSVGDDGAGGGLSERFALDNIRFGTAVLVP